MVHSWVCLQAKVDFYANQKQLDSLLESGSSKNAPEVIASSLAAIGGGGNVYAQSFSVAEKQLDESKKQTKNLEKIAESTEVLASREAKVDELLMRWNWNYKNTIMKRPLKCLKQD